MCTQIHTNKYINTNNKKHEAKTCIRMRLYKRSQQNSLEGENKNALFQERSLD